MKMHLKWHNKFLINKIWTMGTVQQDQSTGSLSFHSVLGNKKLINIKSASQILYMMSQHAHWGWRNTFYYH